EVAVHGQVGIAAGHGVAVAVDPVHGRGLVEGPGDVRDTAAAEADEMPYGVAGTAPVVAVDVDDAVAAAGEVGPAAEHGRDPGALDQLGQRVVDVQRDDQRAVDMAAGEVTADAGVVVTVLGEQQYVLVVVVGQFLADAAQLAGEEGVGEDAGRRFGDD